MADIIVAGNTSGAITISAPLVAGSGVLTLPTGTDTLVGKATTDTLTNKTLTAPAISSAVMTTMASSVLTSGTAVATTSGTSIDFTSIPSWVKRITVMFVGVSTNGTSVVQVQLGTSGGIVTTAYKDMVALVTTVNNTTRGAVYTSGFATSHAGAAIDTWNGTFTFSLLGSNTWTFAGNVYSEANQNISFGAGSLALGGALDRVRLTTVNGTDTFDAGTVNILYE